MKHRSRDLQTRMVVQGQLVEPAVHFSDLYEVFLQDKVRDTRHNQVNFFDKLTKNPNLKMCFGRGGGSGNGGGGVGGGG